MLFQSTIVLQELACHERSSQSKTLKAFAIRRQNKAATTPLLMQFLNVP